VVEAIYEYHEEHNEYPDSLKQLIPDYLDSMPGFDNSLGEFRYLKIQKKFAEDERYGFELKVYDYKKFVIIGAKCMNYLIYQPSEKYPNRTFQKTHKLIGRWAYQTSCRTYGKLNRLIEK
ncbi:MAG: hypothetical protein PHZ27_05975, partial [Candidatus Omnitrophica bacterium]|nr:hypothetical protein [Candidatus Omnitrophota bacterium]